MQMPYVVFAGNLLLNKNENQNMEVIYFSSFLLKKIKIDHKTVTKCDYAANLKSDKIAPDDEAKKFEVTKEKIIKLAQQYKHVDREGKVKKIPTDIKFPLSDSQDNISKYLSRQSERSESTVPKRVVQKNKFVQGKLFFF